MIENQYSKEVEESDEDLPEEGGNEDCPYDFKDKIGKKRGKETYD